MFDGAVCLFVVRHEYKFTFTGTKLFAVEAVAECESFEVDLTGVAVFKERIVNSISKESMNEGG